MAAGQPKWMRYFSIAVLVIGLLMAVLIFIGRRDMMGARYEVSPKEAINYSAAATEDDARKLAEALREIGFFDGSREVDVLLRKEDNATILSFVVNKTTPEVISAFQEIGAAAADRALGRPLTVRLIDENLNTRHELRVE